MKVNCITINTDASYDSDTDLGAFAFHIVSDNFCFKKTGIFKAEITGSVAAEMMAIANALAFLSKQPNLPIAKFIVINCDCLPAIAKIRDNSGKYKYLSSIIRKQLFILAKLTSGKKHSPSVKIRHVKAHNGKKDARSWVNNWCDKEAKKLLRTHLKDING